MTTNRFFELDSIFQYLKSKGYIEIGMGAFSRVFVQPRRPNRVVKISYDECWHEFAEFAMKSDRPMYPDIYTLKYLNQEKTAYFAVMERLIPILPSNPRYKPLKQIFVVFNEAMQEKHGGSPKAAIADMKSFFKNMDHGTKMEIVMLLNASAHINRQFKNKCAHDLSINNVLMRQDGSLVLADPFAPAHMKFEAP